MPVFCDPAVDGAAVGRVIGAGVRTVGNLAAAARMIAEDPTEMLAVIGPARSLTTYSRSPRPCGSPGRRPGWC